MKLVAERRIKDEAKVQDLHVEQMPMVQADEPKPVVETMVRVRGFIGGTTLVLGVLAQTKTQTKSQE